MPVNLVLIFLKFVAKKIAENAVQQAATHATQIAIGAGGGAVAAGGGVGLWWLFSSGADKEREESIQKQKNILTETISLLRQELQAASLNVEAAVNQAEHVSNNLTELSEELPETLDRIVQVQNDLSAKGLLFENTVNKIKADLAEISAESDEMATLITSFVALVDEMNAVLVQHHLALIGQHELIFKLYKSLTESDAQIDDLTEKVSDLIVNNLEQGQTIASQNEEIKHKDATIARIWSSHEKVAQQNLLFRQNMTRKEEPVNEPSSTKPLQ